MPVRIPTHSHWLGTGKSEVFLMFRHCKFILEIDKRNSVVLGLLGCIGGKGLNYNISYHVETLRRHKTPFV